MIRLRWPLPPEFTEITTQYGEDGHMAIDIGCPDGTPVCACMPGVLTGEWTDWGGNVARITGADGWVSRYCHLAHPIMVDSKRVEPGDLVGQVGKSGSAWTGYHLHWETRDYDIAVDPLLYLQGEGSMSVIGVQFQNYPSWAKDLVAKYWPLSRDGWVMALNPPVPDLFPNTHVLGRSMWYPSGYASCDAWESYVLHKGLTGGKEYFEFNLPYYLARKGMVTAWQYINEPIIWSDADAFNYRDGLHVWIGLMHTYGFLGVGGVFSRGNPQLRIVDPSCNYLKIMGPALDECDYLAYHGYGRGRFKATDVWEALRYRLITDELLALGHKKPRWFISELLDDLGGGLHDGWRDDPAYAGSWPLYFGDLRAADAEYKLDGAVAAFVFLCGALPRWRPWELDQPQVIDLGEYAANDVVPVDDLLTVAETWVIPINSNAALWRYILSKGWVPQSQETTHDGTPYMWGWHNNQRTLCGWINGAVIEVATRPN